LEKVKKIMGRLSIFFLNFRQKRLEKKLKQGLLPFFRGSKALLIGKTGNFLFLQKLRQFYRPKSPPSENHSAGALFAFQIEW